MQEKQPCRGGGCARDNRAGIPLQPMIKVMATQVSPMQPMEEHGAADVHAATNGESHDTAGEDAQNGAVACGEESTQEQVFWQNL